MQPINTMVCRLFCILRTHVLTTSADNASNSISKIDGSFEDVTSAFETANQGNEWDAMSQNIAKAHDMLKEGLVGTDDFQTVAQWMSPHIINKDDPTT